jgi:hypothetical protein
MDKRSLKILLLTFLMTIPVFFAAGQVNLLKKLFTVDYDTNYISTYLTDYTTRLYGSAKYGYMDYYDREQEKKMSYRPNNKVLLGVGVNHGILGLNIGINFPFVNDDDDKYGKTKYSDFTARVFSPRFNLTLYLQNYKGYYLKNTGDMVNGWQTGDDYYIRGDVFSRTVGLEVNYIFNSDRFSYRAAILQNEWQKKSAGTLLAGVSFIYSMNKGDSVLVPPDAYFNAFFDDHPFDRSNIFTAGPAIGYAYTLVIKKHVFLMGSANLCGNLGFTRLVDSDGGTKVKSGLTFGLRPEFIVSAGYNSARWYFGASFVNMIVMTQGPVNSSFVSYDTGMLRLNFVRRFATKKPVKILNPGLAK